MRAVVLLAAVACSSKPSGEAGSSEQKPSPGERRVEPRVVTPPPAPRDGRERTTVDMRPFSRACTTDADCRLVDASPCNRCTCASRPIAATDAPAFDAAAARLKCEGVQIYPCVDCLAVVPACHEGTCTARSTEPIPEGGECQRDSDCVVSCVQPGKCCTETSCETTVARAKADKIAQDNRARCTPEALAKCPPVEGPPEYIAPRCRRGVCFGEFLER